VLPLVCLFDLRRVNIWWSDGLSVAFGLMMMSSTFSGAAKNSCAKVLHGCGW
jgi:hypothetical protein